MRRNVDALINSVRSAPLSQFESFPPLGRFRAQKQGGLVLRKAAGCSPSSSAGARKGRLLDGGVELDQRQETAVGEGQAEGGGGGSCGIQLVVSPRGEGQARERHRVQAAERLLLEGMEVREGALSF